METMYSNVISCVECGKRFVENSKEWYIHKKYHAVDNLCFQLIEPLDVDENDIGKHYITHVIRLKNIHKFFFKEDDFVFFTRKERHSFFGEFYDIDRITIKLVRVSYDGKCFWVTSNLQEMNEIMSNLKRKIKLIMDDDTYYRRLYEQAKTYP